MPPIRPEDILPDNVDFVEIQNQKLRKGTVAAVLANAEVLLNPKITEEEKREALETIQDLAPSLISLGMHRHVIWKNPMIQTIIEETLK